jgi:hypothetical protein
MAPVASVDEPPTVIQNARVESPRVEEPVSYAYTSVGLPRRVPRSHAVPSLVEPAAPPAAARPPAPAGGGDAPRRNPTRARGFLNDYQAGVRQGVQGVQGSSGSSGLPGLSTAGHFGAPDTATENGNGEDR